LSSVLLEPNCQARDSATLPSEMTAFLGELLQGLVVSAEEQVLVEKGVELLRRSSLWSMPGKKR